MSQQNPIPQNIDSGESAGEAFKLCLGPHGLADFVDTYWERNAVLVTRHDPFRYRQLVDLKSFDDLVAHSNLRAPFFRIFKNGVEIPRQACTTIRQTGGDLENDLADLNVLYDQYSEGATIVLVALEKKFPPLAQFCAELATLFRCPIQAYAYLTPPNANGPPAHYDTHEVFVLQVEGAKRWRVWDPIRALPLRMNENAYDHDAVIEYSQEVEPNIDATLFAGDSLYIPRGYIHCAETMGTPSLHVSLSAMVDRLLDIVESTMRDSMETLKDSSDAQCALAFGRNAGQILCAHDRDKVTQVFLDCLADLNRRLGTIDLTSERNEYPRHELFEDRFSCDSETNIISSTP